MTNAPPTGAPYLSVVVASRNDDHGGDLLARMQVFLDGLVAQCSRHALDIELIFVEWNPPEDRPRLKDALRWPDGSGRTTVRIIEVPPELHHRFEYSDRLPLFQMIAKNVGIRRAQAPFVLATNIDLLFSDGVMKTLASGELKPGVLYRVERYDVESEIPTGIGIVDQLSWCQDHLLRAHLREASPSFRPLPEDPPETTPLPPPSVAGRRSYVAAVARRVPRVMLRKTRTATSNPRRFYEAPIEKLRAARKFVVGLTAPRLPLVPHTNACGDFTLMSNDDWLRLRGYPELELYSLHIDTLLIHMGRYAGLRERVLRDPIFHLEHGGGYNPNENGKTLFAKLQANGVPWITYPELKGWTNTMAERNAPLDFNDDDWGLVSEDLPEEVLVL